MGQRFKKQMCVQLNLSELEHQFIEVFGRHLDRVDLEGLKDSSLHYPILTLTYDSQSALLHDGIEYFNHLFSDHEIEVIETTSPLYRVDLYFETLIPLLERWIQEEMHEGFLIHPHHPYVFLDSENALLLFETD